jgi:ribosomal protein L18
MPDGVRHRRGAHSGATEEEMRPVRAAAEAEAINPRVSVFATTPHKHTQIISKAPETVVAAIEAVNRQVCETLAPAGSAIGLEDRKPFHAA